jgi:soluble lytic murein transglycosylase-like protein
MNLIRWRRGSFFLLGLFLLLANPALAQNERVKVSPDGSLSIIEKTESGSRSKILVNNDVRELLSSQVQIYVFKNSTQVWPQPFINYAKPGMPRLLRPAVSVKDPRLNELIRKYAQIHGVDVSLIQAVMRAESGGKPDAVSSKGAMGLMQLMPETAAGMGVTDPFDVEQNIAGGVKYLKLCLNRFNNDVSLALAAYNAGPENVSKYQGCPPFAETRNYVATIMQRLTGQQPLLNWSRPNYAVPLPSPEAMPSSNNPAPQVETASVKTAKKTRGNGPKVAIINSGKAKIIKVISRNEGNQPTKKGKGKIGSDEPQG